MVDLTPIIAIAQAEIEANGREVTFIKHNSTLSDANQPWEGPTDARTSPDSTKKMFAVFFNPATMARLGITFEQNDLFPRAEQIMMVSPGTVNVEEFQEVLDGGTYWKIGQIEIFKPGSLVALAYVGVAR